MPTTALMLRASSIESQDLQAAPAIGARVLVIDDDKLLRLAMSIALGACGYRVDEACDGVQALDSVMRRTPDLVLLDLGLPGIDGISVIRTLRTLSNVPVVVFSARDGEAARVAAIEAGADDYVAKPVDIDDLCARIRSALRLSHPTRVSCP